MSVLCLKGSLCKENDFDFRQIFPENCGLAAAINLPGASNLVGQMITMIEKRGERGGGVVSRYLGKLRERRRIGPFSVQFRDFDETRFRRELPGRTAIGHCRYATAGDPDFVANVQPLTVVESKYGPFAIAHNGTLVNSALIKKSLIAAGCAFHSTSDTEILIHLILDSGKKSLEDAIRFALSKVSAAYALLIISRDKVFAIRGPFGVRPLSVAKIGEGYLLCSETVSFDQFPEAEYWRDVEPGEMLVFQRRGIGCRSVTYAEKKEMFCIFECVYFSNPRSRKNGVYHEDFRRALGRQISLENPTLDGDIVVPVLDSGKHFAEGLAEGISLRTGRHYNSIFRELLQRSHGPLGGQSRSFTAINNRERKNISRKKLHLKKGEFDGKRVILVDDSIVRSNTAKVNIERFRQAGAKEVIFVVGFPPIINICPNGMDFQTRGQLIAYRRNMESIRREIGADWLIYLRQEDLYKVVEETYGCGICGGCFGGLYPVIPKTIKD